MTSLYLTIAEMINDQVLEPNSRIKETELSHRLHVSRTPLREALQHLEREHLIIKKGPRLRYIAPFSISQMLHLSTCRQVLEGLIAMQATEKYIQGADITPLLDKHRQIYDTIATNDTEHFQILGLEFHNIMADISGNVIAKSTLHTLNIRFERYRRINTLFQSRKNAIYQEHDAIIKAILMQNPKFAQDMMEFHIANARVGDLHSLKNIKNGAVEK